MAKIKYGERTLAEITTGQSVTLHLEGHEMEHDIEIEGFASGGSGGGSDTPSGSTMVVCNLENPSLLNTIAHIEGLKISYPNATEVTYRAFSPGGDIPASLTYIDLPNVKTINYDAFLDCHSLISVNAPKLQTIGHNAFKGCASLTNIDVSKVTDVGEFAFDDCTSLKSIKFDEGYGDRHVGACGFSGCTMLTSARIPDLLVIPQELFKNCKSLIEADVPHASVVYNEAFMDCESLTKVVIYGVTTIAMNAFFGCKSLTIVELPYASLIGQGVFYGCTSLDTLILHNTGEVCNLDLSAILNTKIATAEGMPTGEGFIYVPTKFYEDYVANFTQQIVAGFGLDEATADYMARAILRKIEDYPEICG